ncbi:Fanconi anemia group F protein [Solea senegalensis]|uniref:Fanconi anemia group F protein n=1 Tax=Solea senegalensis TaxID=28829 RepID=A0AAV6SXJ1_SOLSE|nr:Fanconi anemia group F protein [Solea senegalensis]KAG7522231.1 Fanconi anemia group F protein [Solea senegalensis]
MDTLLKNLASSVELLAVVAQSDVVEQWDEQTLTRAFQWARYCEHLFSRFDNNPVIRGMMEKQLQLTNENLLSALSGYTELSFSDLSQCQHLLLFGLLNNPKLPGSLMKTLFDCKSSADLEVTGLCSRIIQSKSACKILRPLTDSSAVSADAEVQGVVLIERLGALMSQGSNMCRTEHFLDCVLQGCEESPQHFCGVIAVALLTRKNSAPQDILVDWLLKKHSILKLMVTALPPAVITDLAKKHLKFRDAYCDVLKEWASGMEYSLSEGEWLQTCANPMVSYQKLTEHFLALFEACPSLRDDVEKQFDALKVSDGDFDVRGLSVWGDLLSALNK